MDDQKITNDNGIKSELESIGAVMIDEPKGGKGLDVLKKFLNLTGGSFIYCLSAVFVVFGIVKVLGPVLAASDTFGKALPCIFTLHGYELALLGVLVLILSRQVVDDAISLVIIMALFLVGTPMAQGTVANSNIPVSFVFGIIGVAAALLKFYVMRRFVKIPFRAFSISGLGLIIACNYLGPSFLAKSMSVDPSGESSRRGLWLLIWLGVLIGGVLVFIDAVKSERLGEAKGGKGTAFFQRPVMVYIFALILFAASAVHQYSMAFTFALERVLGDFVPFVLVVTLLLLELLRHCRKRFGITEMGVCFLPLAAMMLSIEGKSVLGAWEFGPGVLWYPPVLLALCGLALAGYSMYRRRYVLFYVVYAYFLGVVLTAGFKLQHQYDLNYHTCAITLVISLFVYGAIIRNQYVCLAGVITLCVDLATRGNLSHFVKANGLTETGYLAGVCGLGVIVIYLLFKDVIHKAIPIVGAVFLAVFIYDYLPDSVHWKYLLVLPLAVVLICLVWFRKRDLLVASILSLSLLMRFYILAKYIGHWRYVILGFLLLGVGTFVSLFKNSIVSNEEESERDESPLSRE